VAAFSDGVVVGSAAVQVVERARAEGRDPVAAIESYVATLRAAV
jgi:tryptophan synthase alpha subunit